MGDGKILWHLWAFIYGQKPISVWSVVSSSLSKIRCWGAARTAGANKRGLCRSSQAGGARLNLSFRGQIPRVPTEVRTTRRRRKHVRKEKYTARDESRSKRKRWWLIQLCIATPEGKRKKARSERECRRWTRKEHLLAMIFQAIWGSSMQLPCLQVYRRGCFPWVEKEQGVGIETASLWSCLLGQASRVQAKPQRN